MSLEYYPLSFGLVVGIVNWDVHRYRPILGVLLSLFVSYVSFFIAYFSLGIFGNIRDSILENTNFVISDDSMGVLGFVISPFVIAPLLVFFFYRFVFFIPKSKLTLMTIMFTVLLLAIISYSIISYADNSIVKPYILWQLVMAIALQLIINQKITLK